ncbi:MAG: T9SS type A sorting domain-containing protein [Bacteroidales bacterium]|nr:T9SS type A sorting domain-containing protein [Bacteroidales bacterium]
MSPSPVKDLLTIEGDFSEGYSQISICNLNGTFLFQKQISNVGKVQVDINSFSPGMYVLSISRKGYEPHYIKFIKSE